VQAVVARFSGEFLTMNVMFMVSVIFSTVGLLQLFQLKLRRWYLGVFVTTCTCISIVAMVIIMTWILIETRIARRYVKQLRADHADHDEDLTEDQAPYELFSLGRKWKEMTKGDRGRGSWRQLNCPALSEKLAKLEDGHILELTKDELRGGKEEKALALKRASWKRPCKLHEKVKIHSYVIVAGKRYRPVIHPPKQQDPARREGNRHLERAQTRKQMPTNKTKVVPVTDV